MPYSQLYEYCQTLSPRIPRNTIKAKVLNLTGVNKVTHVRTTLDINSARGFFLNAQNSKHRLVEQCGSHVIVTARGLEEVDINEERFVVLKELMHLFDLPPAATDSGDKFQQLLEEFGPTQNRSAQSQAESTCFYRALAAICPEQHRLEYLKKRENGQIDDYAIGLEIGLPSYLVERLFVADYPEMTAWLCG
jgi:hypothetical protein